MDDPPETIRASADASAPPDADPVLAEDIIERSQAPIALSPVSRRARRPVLVLAVGVALVLVAGAVVLTREDGSGQVIEESPPEHRVAVAQDSLRPPGTVLADGVEVQPGSSLVGAVWPVVETYPVARGAAVAPVGWQAALLVEGDPIEVWDAYAAQFGIDDRAGAVDACVVEQNLASEGDELGPPPARFLTEGAMDTEDRLVCRARLGDVPWSDAGDSHMSPTMRVAMDLVVGTSTCLDAEDPCMPRLSSHLYLRVTDGPLPGDAAVDTLGTADLRALRAREANDGLDPYSIPRAPVVAPRLESRGAESRLPGAGERLDDGLDGFLGRDERVLPPAAVPEDARSLIAPALLLTCNGGLVAVMEISGGPADAVASFDPAAVTQFGSEWMRKGSNDGVDWAAFKYEAVGGYGLTTTAVATGKDTSIVLATQCGD